MTDKQQHGRNFQPAIARMVAATAFLLPVAAQAESDKQYWMTLNGEVKVDANDMIYASAIFRSQPDEIDLGQRQLRIGLNHKFDNGSAIAIAYTHVRYYNDNAPDVVQHRLTQAYIFPIGEIGRGRVEGRIQSEQIFPVHSETGFRGRARVRWIKQLDAGKKIELTLSEELFWAFNDTAWGLDTGFNTNRAGATLRFKLNDHFGIAPQYVWQVANRTNQPDRNDHVFGVILDAKF